MILTDEELLLNLSHEIYSSALLQSYQGIYSVRSLIHTTTRNWLHDYCQWWEIISENMYINKEQSSSFFTIALKVISYY